MATPLHPAVTVSNIRTLIPITLDIESGHYTSCSELFKNHCKAFQVYDHLQPRTAPATSSGTDKEKSAPTESWERLDAIVLQWIYGTISTDLLHTVLKPNTTAYDAWTALSNLFQDNKATRTIDLNNWFATTRLDQFTSMSAYCQAMKVIYDQLINVGASITDEQLVLQILTGLTEQYESVALFIQQTKPLPDFYDTRSRLCMAETRKLNQAKQAAQIAGTALAATADRGTSPRTSDNHTDSSDRTRECGRGRGRGRGRGNSNRGRGYSNSASQSVSQSAGQPFSSPFPYWASPPPNYYSHQWAPWTIPPCPYSTAAKSTNPAQGILGPRPAQNYAASQASSYDGQTMTDINQALYNLSMN
ncbi:uncharacterized protein LOC110932745 [Helianthus annuus]|uniref:uncharacterized protein LOC110932745 n=1 Tax=Helianthus annuus TaxID=4232 RepID=UPI000B8F9F64|nr:uncharacterized protein LOC110932745 [Helianthus annuus]